MELSYRADLPKHEIISLIGKLVSVERSVEHLLCRYLADLADRIAEEPFDALGGYANIYHAAWALFRMKKRRTRERVRIGRALRELKAIEAAFLDGELCFSRVRELTRVACAEDEQNWLRLGLDLPMRMLEKRVAEAADAQGQREREADKTREPPKLSWTSPETVEVRFTVRAEAWALFERAMEGARMASDVASEELLSPSEALEAVARDALAQQQRGGKAGAADPRRTVVLYECVRCGHTELEAGSGAVELAEGAAAALGCGAEVCDLRTEGRVVQRGSKVPAEVRRAVQLRDRNRCRVPGCGRRRYCDVHPLKRGRAGGAHTRSSCCLLCTTHHRMLHNGELRIEGDADGALRFFNGRGELIADERDDPIGASGSCVAGACAEGDPIGSSGSGGAGACVGGDPIGSSGSCVAGACAEGDPIGSSGSGGAGACAEGDPIGSSGSCVAGACAEGDPIGSSGSCVAGACAEGDPMGSSGSGGAGACVEGDPMGSSGSGGVGACVEGDPMGSSGSGGVGACVGSDPIGSSGSCVAGACDVGAPTRTRDWRRRAANRVRLLKVMGARGGWHPDELIAATGLGVVDVSVALAQLELDQLILRDILGLVHPAAALKGTP